MALMIEYEGPWSYAELLNTIMTHGKPIAPRDQLTYEVRNAVIVVSDPTTAVPVGVGRKLSAAIGAAETAQLIAGVSDVAQLNSASGGRFDRYTNDGVLLGAYGPRIHEHMPLVVERLATDPDTRQAIAPIWRPNELENEDQRDVPCTVDIGWMIRDDALHMTTHMRSNDAWYGVPYDFWMFTRLQMTLARVMSVDIGEYVHTVDSLHVYERDVEKIAQLHPFDYKSRQPPRFGTFGTDTRKNRKQAPEIYVRRWNKVRLQAQAAVMGRYADKLPGGAIWYAHTLNDHLSGNIVCSLCHYVLDRDKFRAQGGDSNRLSRCLVCLERQRQERPVDPLQSLKTRLRRFGLTMEQYVQMVKDQNGCCFLCGNSPDMGRFQDFHFDHDHATDEFRGLLCNNCNMTLGLADDDPIRLERMARYVRGELRPM